MGTDQLTATAGSGGSVDRSSGHGLTDSASGMSTFSDGLSNAEIDRFSLAAGEVIEVYRLAAPLQGGGTEANFALEVYDATNTAVLESVTGGGLSATASPGASETSGDGAEVIVRASNASGGVVTASPQYRLNVTDA